MKVTPALLLKCFILMVLALLALLVVADAYIEVIGIPAPLIRRAQTRIRDEWGVSMEAGRVRLGLLRGGHAEDIRLSWPGRRHTSLRARRLSFRPSVGALLTGKLRPGTVTIHEGTLERASTAEAGAPRQLALHILHAQGQFDGNDLKRFSLDGQFGDMGIRAEGCVLDLLGSRPHSPVTRARSMTQKNDEDTWVAQVVDQLGALNLDPARAQIELDVRASASMPSVTVISGRLALRDMLYRSTVVRLLEANITYRQQELKVSDILMLTEGGDRAEGEITIWLDDRLVAGQISGEVRTATLRQAMPPDRASDNWLLQSFNTPHPLTFQAELQPSPLTLKEARASGQVAGRHVRVRGVPASQVSAQVAYADGCLAVTDVNIQWSEQPAQTDMTGAFSWWPAEKQIAGEAQGVGSLLTRLPPLTTGASHILSRINWGGTPPRISCKLARSPLDWRQWNGDVLFATAEVRYEGWHVHRTSGKLGLRAGTLELLQSRLDWNDEGTNALELKGHVNVTQLLDEARATCTADIVCRVTPPAQPGQVVAPPSSEQPKATVTIMVDRCGPAVLLSGDLDGLFRPAELYRVLQGPLRLPHSKMAARIREFGAPATVKLHMEPCEWPIQTWAIRGTIAAKDVGYKSLKVQSVDARVQVTPKQILFREIRATTQAGDAISLDVDVNLDPPALWLKDGVLRGDPGLAAVFIEAPKGRSLYEAIWRDFEWDAANPPTVKLGRLVNRFDPVSRDWDLRMDAHIDVENARYRKVDTSAISANVQLMLPGAVSISDVTIQRGESVAKGDVRILTEGVPSCRFELTELKGGCTPKSILRTIRPGWETILADFTFAPDTEVTCRGTFFLDDQPELRLDRGTVITSSCRYKSVEFRSVNGTWGVNGKQVVWDVPKAQLYGGEASVTGHFDATLNHGGLALKLSQVQLKDLLGDLGVSGDNDAITESKLAGNCRLTFLRGWSGMDLQLSGNGRIRISESNLWSIPLFAQLGQLVRLSSLGRISALEADLDFNGERVVVPSLSTNGTIISLSGNGEYSWQSDKLNFRVHGETLKKVHALSFVLRPLSWVFDAQLTGTVADHRWRMISVLEKALSGIGKNDVNDVE